MVSTLANPTVTNTGGQANGAGARTIAGGAEAFLPANAGDRVNGRATATTMMTVVDQSYGVVAQNTPGALAGDLQRIDDLVASLNKNYVASARGPIVLLPINGGAMRLRFDDAFQFNSYVQRSATPLISDAVLADAASSVLGRPASNGEVGAMQDQANHGKSLSEIRWGQAHSADAAQQVTKIYGDTLGRAPGSGLPAAQDALGGGMSLDQLRSNAAHSQEATSQIAAQYAAILGRGLDAAEFWRNYLTAGHSLVEVRSALAHSGEARGQVTGLVNSVLGRADDGSSNFWLDRLAEGWAMRDVRWAFAHSAEAGAAVGALYSQVLGRAADSAGQSGWQDAMGSAWALRDVRWAARSTAAANPVGRMRWAARGRCGTCAGTYRTRPKPGPLWATYT